jgi:uncharacterized protein YchJ
VVSPGALHRVQVPLAGLPHGYDRPGGRGVQPPAGAWKKSLLGYLDQFEFQSLEIGEVEAVADDAPLCRVAFRANFAQKGTINLLTLCEQSTFRRVNGAWLYAQGHVNYEAQSL